MPNISLSSGTALHLGSLKQLLELDSRAAGESKHKDTHIHTRARARVHTHTHSHTRTGILTNFAFACRTNACFQAKCQTYRFPPEERFQGALQLPSHAAGD